MILGSLVLMHYQRVTDRHTAMPMSRSSKTRDKNEVLRHALQPNNVFVQTMNILIVNQSVVDLCASFFTLMTAAVEVDGTRMSRDSVYDQFVCRFWLTRTALWSFLVTSTYGIVLTALDRTHGIRSIHRRRLSHLVQST